MKITTSRRIAEDGSLLTIAKLDEPGQPMLGICTRTRRGENPPAYKQMIEQLTEAREIRAQRQLILSP